MFPCFDQGPHFKPAFSMLKNAHRVVEVKNKKNYVTLLMHEFLLKYLFHTPFNFKVILFLQVNVAWWQQTQCFAAVAAPVIPYMIMSSAQWQTTSPQRPQWTDGLPHQLTNSPTLLGYKPSETLGKIGPWFLVKFPWKILENSLNFMTQFVWEPCLFRSKSDLTWQMACHHMFEYLDIVKSIIYTHYKIINTTNTGIQLHVHIDVPCSYYFVMNFG